MLTVFGVLLIVIIFIMAIHNSIIKKYNTVKQAWADVLAQERQVLKILPKLNELLESHANYEKSTLVEVTQLRSSINKLNDGEINTSALSEVQDLNKKVRSGFNATFEAYPELKQSDLYKNLMAETTEQEENVGASIRIFNSNVNRFNTGIEVFPNSMVNSIFTQKTSVAEFTDSDAADEIEYKPEF